MADSPPHLRRVLVALDPAEQCCGALETAARLAADSQAELVGVFVEETDLLQAAALPVTSIVRSDDMGREAVDRAKMERGLKAWATRAQATLTAAAERWQIKATFQVARGSIAETLLAEARRCDLLAIGAVSRPSQRRRVGATARRLAREAPCAVMVTRSAMGGPAIGRGHLQGRVVAPVRVLYEGNPAVLDLAERLARMDALPIEVFTLPALAAAAETRLLALGSRPALQSVVAGATEIVARQLSETPAQAVVLDRQGALGSKLETEGLLQGLVGTVLLLDGATPEQDRSLPQEAREAR